MNISFLDKLQPNELSFTSDASNKPFVIRWHNQSLNKNKAETLSYFKNNADSIRQLVKDNGSVLFRDLPLTDPHDYESALNILGYDLYESNYGGASPRSNVTKKTFVSTEAPKPFIIGLHTEFCYQSKRPGMISFFCVKSGTKYGETPIFDCEKVWNSLSTELQNKLECKGVLYKRFFPGKKSLLNFRKTWKDTFQTQDRNKVEVYLNAEGMNFSWGADDSLTTELKIPAVLVDPTTNRKTLSITMFNLDSIMYNFQHFRERYNPIKRAALEWIVKKEYKRKDTFLQVFLGDGTSFTREESEEVQRAAWKNAIAFNWQPQDLLILDNIRFSHSRLNVEKPREIIAAMADQYDVRDYQKKQSNTQNVQFESVI